ncbi:I78 family peptidase inhibitor [Qipengyuania sp. DGS5-3]|uniref:I78 family peptidase inhibitor n=1 Tax=Qipengyuania sp. DGS5-3 TaxID=3349632 RepID=UPI0036D3A8BD
MTNTASETGIAERELVRGDQGTCNARGLEDAFLAKYATQEIGAELLKQSGARTLQWIPPRTQVTMDFRQDRLRVGYDDMKEINRIVCQ